MLAPVANYLVEELKRLNFKVMRYDAFSSDSVYLKLDDGVVGTIRISDHKGKKHLRYKYNLIKDSQRYQRNDNGVTRYFFPLQDIEMLIEKVVSDRRMIVEKYGDANYEKYMALNRKRGKFQKGFWQLAKYV